MRGGPGSGPLVPRRPRRSPVSQRESQRSRCRRRPRPPERARCGERRRHRRRRRPEGWRGAATAPRAAARCLLRCLLVLAVCLTSSSPCPGKSRARPRGRAHHDPRPAELRRRPPARHLGRESPVRAAPARAGAEYFSRSPRTRQPRGLKGCGNSVARLRLGFGLTPRREVDFEVRRVRPSGGRRGAGRPAESTPTATWKSRLGLRPGAQYSGLIPESIVARARARTAAEEREARLPPSSESLGGSPRRAIGR